MTKRRRKTCASGALFVFLCGCSHLPGFQSRAVYVDLQKLAENRPEWGAVAGLDSQLAGLGAAAAVPSAAGPRPIPTVRLARLPAVADPSPTPQLPVHRNTEQEIRRRIALVRQELEAEAAGEVELFGLTKHQQYEAQLFTELSALENQFAGRRLEVLSGYKSRYTNLELEANMYQSWLQALPPPALRTASNEKEYARLEGRLNAVLEQMKRLIAEQTVAVNKIELDRSAAESRLKRERRAALQQLLEEHEAEIDQRIQDSVHKAELNEAKEARSRLRNFESGSLYSFTAGSVDMSVPTMPSVIVTRPGRPDTAYLDRMLAGQRASLLAQRNELATVLLKDTRSWAEAICDRRHWRLVGSPENDVPDFTAAFMGWLHGVTIPATPVG